VSQLPELTEGPLTERLIRQLSQVIQHCRESNCGQCDAYCGYGEVCRYGVCSPSRGVNVDTSALEARIANLEQQVTTLAAENRECRAALASEAP
jgi:hypothetical protein